MALEQQQVKHNKRNIRDKVERLRKCTKFSRAEIERLLKLHEKTAAPYRDCKKDKFRDFLHSEFDMTDIFLLDRVCRAFDPDFHGCVCDWDWVKGMSTFLLGDIDDKLAFVFACYDLNTDGYISREEMFQFLKDCLVKHSSEEDPDEGVKDLVELALKKLDVDHDSRISMSDFKEAVKQEPLLIEFLGQCFPSPQAAHKFLKMIKNDP